MTTDIKALLQQLTLEEKAAMCTGLTAWKTVDVERLGIPSIWMSDGPHGLRREVKEGKHKSLPATCFPTASALASSWDVGLMHELGEALAEECIAQGVDVLLGPGNNVKRSPLCGRNFEYFSEDPYLGGEMSASLITGLQDKGVGASLKHYVANNQETWRMVVDAQIDERTLREIYLAGFERAVKKAQPWTVMCSYNRINGTYASEHAALLRHVLKEEWGFEGLVVSDWGAVHERVTSLLAGLDLAMPGPQASRTRRVVEAVESGRLPQSVLDEAVERILRVVYKAAATPKDDNHPLDLEEHHALARRAAAETMVLLKNEGNLLPLQGAGKIAVIGVAARDAHYQGGGSSHVNPTRVDSPFEELQKHAGDAELTYAQGDMMEEGFDQAKIDAAVAIAAEAEVALLYIGLPSFKESEGRDRPDMSLSEQQVALIRAVSAVQPRCVVVLNNGSPITMDRWIDGVPAVLEAWLMGQAGGSAVADILFGVVNPSGRLAETFPHRLSDTPAYLNFPGSSGEVRYGEGIFVGYRYYDAKQVDVLFPFGYGLSYTTFDVQRLRLSSTSISDTTPLTVTVDVTNTGKRFGKTVIQVYVHDCVSDLPRPYKELKGFVKVALEAGETKTISVVLEPRAFAYYHPDFARWITESGAFDILVGQSGADTFLRAAVTVRSSQPLTRRLHRFSTLREWVGDLKGREALKQMLAELPLDDMSRALFPEASEWLKNLPLDVVFALWDRGRLTLPPEEIVTQILAKVS